MLTMKKNEAGGETVLNSLSQGTSLLRGDSITLGGAGEGHGVGGRKSKWNGPEGEVCLVFGG